MAEQNNSLFGCRIPQDWLEEFITLAHAQGKDPSDLALEAFAQYLGKTDTSTSKVPSTSEIQALQQRLLLLEQKLEQTVSLSEFGFLLERLKRLEQAIAPAQSSGPSIATESHPPNLTTSLVDNSDEIYDEPDEILYDFLQP